MALLDTARRRIIPTEDTAFRPFDRYGKPVEGLSWLPLSPDAERGQGCYLIRFDAGGRSMPHMHVGIEEFLVLDGELVDSDGTVFKAGDFVSYDAGTKHHSVAPDGCTIAVFLREPNQLLEGEEGTAA